MVTLPAIYFPLFIIMVMFAPRLLNRVDLLLMRQQQWAKSDIYGLLFFNILLVAPLLTVIMSRLVLQIARFFNRNWDLNFLGFYESSPFYLKKPQ